MNKLLKKLKSDLGKTNELIQEGKNIISHDRTMDNREVSNNVTNEKTKEKGEEHEMITGV